MSWKNLPIRDVAHYINQYKINHHHHLPFKPFFHFNLDITLSKIRKRNFGKVLFLATRLRMGESAWLWCLIGDRDHVFLSLARNRYWSLCWWHVRRPRTTALGPCGALHEGPGAASSWSLDRTLFFKEFFIYMGLSPMVEREFFLKFSNSVLYQSIAK